MGLKSYVMYWEDFPVPQPAYILGAFRFRMKESHQKNYVTYKELQKEHFTIGGNLRTFQC